MAETATKTTTPRRARRSAPASTKAATGATKAKKATVPAETLTFDVAPMGPSKKGTYTVFDVATDAAGNETGCVGKFYAPLGATGLSVTVTGPGGVLGVEDASDEE